MLIGEKIKELRKSSKITQEQLGNAVGVSKMAISYFEKGKKSPGRETLENIADYFGVTTDYLLGRSEDPRFNETDNNRKDELAKKFAELVAGLPIEEQENVWKQAKMYVNFAKTKDNE